MPEVNHQGAGATVVGVQCDYRANRVAYISDVLILGGIVDHQAGVCQVTADIPGLGNMSAVLLGSSRELFTRLVGEVGVRWWMRVGSDHRGFYTVFAIGHSYEDVC